MGLRPKLHIDPAADDYKKAPAKGRELQSIEMYAFFQAAIHQHEPGLMERLKTCPNAWRDYRLLETIADRVLDAIYASLPNKTMARIVAGSNNLELRVAPKSVNRARDYIMVEYEDFRHIVKGLADGTCGICLGEQETAKGCPMRKLLAEYLPPDDGQPFGSCPYAGTSLGKAVGL